MQWWQQIGAWQIEMRAQYEAAKKEGWEAEYEEWLDSLDQEPWDQFNRGDDE